MIETCYKDITSRLETLELQSQYSHNGLSTSIHLNDEASSIRTVRGSQTNPNAIKPGDYLESLEKSWVYRRNNALDSNQVSLYSRDGCSMAWSCLSGLSCAEVSNISIINLPITFVDVYNPTRQSQTWPMHVVTSPAPSRAEDKDAWTDESHNQRLSRQSPLNFSWPRYVETKRGTKSLSWYCKRCKEISVSGGKHVQLEWRHWHLECFRCC